MLLFVQSKERAKELYKELVFEDIKADVIHADLSQTEVILFCEKKLQAWLSFILQMSVVLWFLSLILICFQREDAVDNFRSGKTWVLIATDVVARGMDFKGVKCVVNYDFPESAAAYIHRIGIFSYSYYFCFTHLLLL